MRDTGGASSNNKRRAIILTILVGLAAVMIYFVMRGGPTGTDEDQIRALLAEGERAVEEKDLSGIMNLISREYKDDAGLNRDRIRLLIAQGLREQASIYVTLNNVSIETEGETATVSLNASVETESRKGERNDSDFPLTFQLQKEPGHRFLVIPTHNWRVISSSGSGISFGEEMFGL